jgi:hypothetical protein
MIRLHETIDIARPIDDVVAYTSDFGICSPPADPDAAAAPP